MSERALALALALATMAGCAHAPLVCPARGGGRWIELSSAHFRMRTDVGPGRARATLADFEASYAALSSGVLPWRGGPPGAIEPPMEIVLFDRDDDFRALAPDGATGWFAPRQNGEVDPAPTIVIGAAATATPE